MGSGSSSGSTDSSLQETRSLNKNQERKKSAAKFFNKTVSKKSGCVHSTSAFL
jgi:hypothetical protein